MEIQNPYERRQDRHYNGTTRAPQCKLTMFDASDSFVTVERPEANTMQTVLDYVGPKLDETANTFFS